MPSEGRVMEKIKHFVYRDLQSVSNRGNVEEICKYFEEQGIVSPLNNDISKINQGLLENVPGTSFHSTSIDQISEGLQSVPEEVLNRINPPGFPFHIIDLKVGVPVLLLRNLNIAKGLVNGTHLLVKDIKNHVLRCTIMTGPRRFQQVLIPKIKLTYEDDEDFGISFTRYQFPITLAFAITINKSQGQSFKIVGIYLQTHVFSHGQLYVALSRTRYASGVLIGGVGPVTNDSTTNIVCRPILTSK
ncbi:hypothetical protein O181_110909 [Austropuccinia psidii MF-1]|uniref:DNA helicase Pif1-like 2B domain-containing protein n=1 Tax=Austropuccinia psidii MF-1 TaxID=1389203 RepID=A0A9Q3K0Z8_9BASI|nr:hypothetical protein [Austropuccinia psidii MF-1]